MKRVVFIDGKCVLCEGAARWLYAVDKQGRLLFSSLQGETAKELQQKGVINLDIDSVMYVRDFGGLDEDVFVKSQAVIELGKDLGGLGRCLLILRILPRDVRDALYDWGARNRLKWWGEKTECGLPEAEFQKRILP